jgi:hypothetical protein
MPRPIVEGAIFSASRGKHCSSMRAIGAPYRSILRAAGAVRIGAQLWPGVK